MFRLATVLLHRVGIPADHFNAKLFVLCSVTSHKAIAKYKMIGYGSTMSACAIVAEILCRFREGKIEANSALTRQRHLVIYDLGFLKSGNKE